MSNKGSYCKVDQNPPVCFGIYQMPKKHAQSLVEQALNPLMFCDGIGDHNDPRCADAARIQPVTCNRRPVWNKQGRVVDLENFLARDD